MEVTAGRQAGPAEARMFCVSAGTPACATQTDVAHTITRAAMARDAVLGQDAVLDIVVTRRVAGVALTRREARSGFSAVALHCPADPQINYFAIVLLDADGRIDLTVQTAVPAYDVVAAWRGLARDLCLPAAILQGDGTLDRLSRGLGALTVGRAVARRRRAPAPASRWRRMRCRNAIVQGSHHRV